MDTKVTLNGIDQAISDLNYRNKNTLKCKLLMAVRQFYTDDAALEDLGAIDPDELIRLLWDTGDDPAAIQGKRKNFSSVKSTINADLKKLSDAGKNPEGISIDPDNIFTMSDEAKDTLLKSFLDTGIGDGPIDLGQITDILNIIEDALPDAEAIDAGKGVNDIDKLAVIKALIQDMAEKVGLEIDINERSEDEVLEEVDEDGVLEEIAEDGVLEEVGEDEVLEEVGAVDLPVDPSDEVLEEVGPVDLPVDYIDDLPDDPSDEVLEEVGPVDYIDDPSDEVLEEVY